MLGMLSEMSEWEASGRSVPSVTVSSQQTITFINFDLQPLATQWPSCEVLSGVSGCGGLVSSKCVAESSKGLTQSGFCKPALCFSTSFQLWVFPTCFGKIFISSHFLLCYKIVVFSCGSWVAWQS